MFLGHTKREAWTYSGMALQTGWLQLLPHLLKFQMTVCLPQLATIQRSWLFASVTQVKRPFLKGRPPVTSLSSGFSRNRRGSASLPPPLSVKALRALPAVGQGDAHWQVRMTNCCC